MFPPGKYFTISPVRYKRGPCPSPNGMGTNSDFELPLLAAPGSALPNNPRKSVVGMNALLVYGLHLER
jgi:hypothetical protein